MLYKLANSIRLDKVYANKEIKQRIIFEKYIYIVYRIYMYIFMYIVYSYI